MNALAHKVGVCTRHIVSPTPLERVLEVQIDEVSGTIKSVRFVEHEGIVSLWQSDSLGLPVVLAGQYVSLEFDVNTAVDAPNIRHVIWKGGEELVVAEFSHLLGVGKRQSQRLVLDCIWCEFSEEHRNQDYDEQKYRYGSAKRAFGSVPKRSE